MEPSKILIYTHAGCTDGHFAAAFLSLLYSKSFSTPCVIVPLTRGPNDIAPEYLSDEEHASYLQIVFLDFVDAKTPVIYEHFQNKVCIYDHHVSALSYFNLKTPNFYFSQDLSASGLLLEAKSGLIHGLNWLAIRQMGNLISHSDCGIPYHVPVKDRTTYDIHSIALNYVLRKKYSSLESMQELLNDLYGHSDIISTILRELINEGMLTYEALVREAESIASQKNPFLFSFNGELIPAANARGIVMEPVAQAMAEKYPVGVAYFINGNIVQLSFRSLNHSSNSGYALRLAEMLNGGGHPNAAGAKMSLSNFCNLLSALNG